MMSTVKQDGHAGSFVALPPMQSLSWATNLSVSYCQHRWDWGPVHILSSSSECLGISSSRRCTCPTWHWSGWHAGWRWNVLIPH